MFDIANSTIEKACYSLIQISNIYENQQMTDITQISDIQHLYGTKIESELYHLYYL